MMSWKTISAGLAVVWAFFTGYVTALGFTQGMSWSVRDVILYFPKGGMTGDVFMAFFNFARWAFFILTLCLLVSFFFTLEEIKK